MLENMWVKNHIWEKVSFIDSQLSKRLNKSEKVISFCVLIWTIFGYLQKSKIRIT